MANPFRWGKNAVFQVILTVQWGITSLKGRSCGISSLENRVRQQYLWKCVAPDFQATGPALILIDETLSYITKASGIPVGRDYLSDQAQEFLLELTHAVNAAADVALVLTMTSSPQEQIGEAAIRAAQEIDTAIRILRRTRQAEVSAEREELSVPITRPASMATAMGTPASNRAATTIPLRAILDPADRSKPPETNSMVMPMDTMPSIANPNDTARILADERKPGSTMDMMTIMTNRIAIKTYGCVTSSSPEMSSLICGFWNHGW